ncbi:ImmA/IrrE family metallo-endopeptidase [Xanthomonas hortorum]|uniref:ImmA/IrrE family metallo-endopeptidase n=1 Tax=Xanthomonas hortorum TaxID=56454 RepID=UPI0033164296
MLTLLVQISGTADRTNVLYPDTISDGAPICEIIKIPKLQPRSKMINVSPSISSVQKGDTLEDAVYTQVLQDVSAGLYGLNESCCRIFQKKGYYSKDRESNIIFDVSLELWMPGASEWSVLYIFECKNYSKKVPVNDIEEFFQKVEQVGSAATKAIVVSSNAFQEGAVSFARSKRIGLARYFPESQLEWVLRRSPSTLKINNNSNYSSFSSEALTSDYYISRFFDYHCMFGDRHFVSLPSLALEMATDISGISDSMHEGIEAQKHELGPPWIPFVSAAEIEGIARDFSLKVPHSGSAAALDHFCLYLKKHQGLVISHSILPPGVLATVSFEPLIINIDPSQSGTEGRARFTLAHELGHVCLDHGRFIRRDTLRELDAEIDEDNEIAIKDIARLEWQANYFAACLLLPARALVAEVKRQAHLCGIKNRGFGLLYLDDQKCNKDSFLIISSAIASRFKVSRQVVKLRLKELGLLQEVSTVKSSAEMGLNFLRTIDKQ